jgi:hypothetical protein
MSLDIHWSSDWVWVGPSRCNNKNYIFIFLWPCIMILINLLLPTWCTYVLFRNLSNYIITSTCFGHRSVHHQEVSIVHAPSDVSLLTGCRARYWLKVNNLTFNQYPDDGHCDVRNMLRWWCNYLNYEIKHMCIKLVITNWLNEENLLILLLEIML